MGARSFVEKLLRDAGEEPKKPRVRFCWICSRKLWGNSHISVTGPDGNERIMHKFCHKHHYKEQEPKK